MKKILKYIGIVVAVVVIVAVVGIGILTVTEYKPDDTEAVAVTGESSGTVSVGDSLSILTWNIGYGALGANADFFMDGGEHVSTATKEQTEDNMAVISSLISDTDPDIVMLQEVDTDSKRSHYINESDYLMSALTGYESTFAYNYKVLYVPYPLPTIGKVNCGINTLSKFDVTESTRLSLPCPFTYPIRICNLKRCVMVDRIPLEGSDKELVIVNLHLEAYDSGEGKAAQTAMLKEILETEAEAGNYVIAGGDFNQTFSNVDTSAYPLVSEDMWQAGKIDVDEFDNLTFVTDNSTPTCRSLDKPYEGADPDNFQYYMIDGFIVSDNIQVDEVSTIDTKFENTDHNPVQMKFTLK